MLRFRRNGARLRSTSVHTRSVRTTLMPTDIAIAVVEDQGRFLIGQRPAEVALGGLWEFPGGKVEPGELPASAAVRECLEEAGVAVDVIGMYPLHEHAYAHDTVRLHFFRCVARGSSEPRFGFRWVERVRLREYEFPRGNDEMLSLLLEGA
jgi:8-oxo-dGTP diphosphatase